MTIELVRVKLETISHFVQIALISERNFTDLIFVQVQRHRTLVHLPINLIRNICSTNILVQTDHTLLKFVEVMHHCYVLSLLKNYSSLTIF